MCSAFNPSKGTHTWSSGAANAAAQLGVRCLAQGSHLSRGQFLPEPRFKPTTSCYKSDALSIRPWLPHLLWSGNYKLTTSKNIHLSIYQCPPNIPNDTLPSHNKPLVPSLFWKMALQQKGNLNLVQQFCDYFVTILLPRVLPHNIKYNIIILLERLASPHKVCTVSNSHTQTINPFTQTVCGLLIRHSPFLMCIWSIATQARS